MVKPLSFSSIVRKNKRRLKIQLATDEDMIFLTGKLVPEDIRDHLVCFRLVKLEFENNLYFVALGFNDFEPYVANDVITVSERLILTRDGGLYSIEEIKQTEPPEVLLRQLCHYLKTTGINTSLDLNVPEF